MNSLISIVVPIYNSEKYLAECIESILSQTYKNLEVILVNDGSTDNSLKICNHYKALDNRVIVIDKPNAGVSSARNFGIEIAKGDYIGFVDSDDYIENNMYELLYNQIKKDKSEVCAMTSYTIKSFDEYYLIYKKKMISGKEALKLMFLLRFPTSLWAFLYSKNVIENCKLNSEIHFFEDFEFNYRILSLSDSVSICSNKLYNYRANEDSINSQNINDKRLTCLKIYNMIKNDLKQKPELCIYTPFFRSHFLISVVVSLLKSTHPNKRYFNVIKKESKKLLLNIMPSRFVPIKYKITILACSVNTTLLWKLMRFKRQDS